jgi:tetratricopeptide (TPR) repeat protein
VELSPAEKDIQERLSELMAQVMAGDDFKALGLSLSATDGDVHVAYERVLQQIPDAEEVGANGEFCDQAARIRKRLYTAYLHLKDPEARRAHVELREEQWKDEEERSRAARSREAESWFRKGEDLLRFKQYDKAGEAFGMAYHFAPDEGDYLSHLGWAMFLSNPNDEVVQREAMENIARGIKRSPKRELAYVYLGRIVQAKGDKKTARKIFRRALSVNPDCEAAKRALQRLGSSEKKDKGLLSRLWKRAGG